MTGFLPSGKLRAVAALIAAYAVALQAVFVTLAPMQVQADGTIAVYCSGSGNTVVPDTNDPAAPAPGKMQCVFCGACAAGAVILPGAVTPAYLAVERVVSPAREASRGTLAAINVRDGPARAPPLSV
jgi:hypothetical protein